MAGTKAVTNAGEAAARQGGGGFKIPSVPKKPEALLAMAQQYNISTGQAKDLFGNLLPQLQKGGVEVDQIKGLLDAEDPHLAAKQFLADTRAPLEEVVAKSSYGYTPEQIANMSLLDLSETAKSVSDKPQGQAPSRVRGQTNEAPKTESRLPGEETASSSTTDMNDQKGVPPVVPQPDKRKMSAERQAKMQAAAATKENVKKFGETGSLEGVNWLQANRDPMVVGREAERGNWANLTQDDMTGERGSVFKPIDQPAPASPSVKPAPADEVAPKPETPSGPSVTKTDPILRGIAAAGPALRNSFSKYPAATTAAAIVGTPLAGMAVRYGVPTAYRGLEKMYGAAFGSGEPQQPAAGPQGQATPAGQPPVQINILPREALRQLEQRRPAPQQMAPPPQAPMQSPQQAPAGKTTDIIRQLSGRMV